MSQRTHNAGAPGCVGIGLTDPQRGQTELFIEAVYSADAIVFRRAAAADFRLISKSCAVDRMPLPGRGLFKTAELTRGGGGASSVGAVAEATGGPSAFSSPGAD